jgi:DeoR/GlpR family transcriptional regulator of sugar metabolism
MFVHARLQSILDLLERRRRLSVQEIEETFGASPATTRRDLKALEDRGLAVRVYGGVLHPSAVLGETTFEARDAVSPAQKEAIARGAADLVPAGATLYVDGGTTCLDAGRRLLSRRDIIIYTNSVPLASLATQGGPRVIAIGGEVKAVSRALVGDIALDWVGNLRFDMALMGASGACARDGVSATALDEAAVKRRVLARARHAVLLLDSSKWDLPREVRFAQWGAFRTVVSDAGLPRLARVAIRRAGPQLIITQDGEGKTT